jgi:hypothetical protein
VPYLVSQQPAPGELANSRRPMYHEVGFQALQGWVTYFPTMSISAGYAATDRFDRPTYSDRASALATERAAAAGSRSVKRRSRWLERLTLVGSGNRL